MSNVITNIETRDGIDSYIGPGFRGVERGITRTEPFSIREAFEMLPRADFTLSLRTMFASSNVAMATPKDQRAALPLRAAIVRVPGMRVVVRDDIGLPLAAANRTLPLVSNRRVMARLLGANVNEAGAITSERDDSKLGSFAVLGNGEQAYATVPLHAPRKAGAAGVIARNRFLHWGHDGRTSITDRLIQHDVKCENTLAMAGRGRLALHTVRHKKSAAHVEAKLIDVGAEMRRLLSLADEQDAAFDAMARKPLTDREAGAVLAFIFGSKGEKAGEPWRLSKRGEEKVADILDVFNGDGSRGGSATGVTGAHTAWDLLAAGTFFLDRTAPPARSAEGLDPGEAYAGPVAEVLRRETTESLVDYRQRLTDALTDVASGADALALVGAA